MHRLPSKVLRLIFEHLGTNAERASLKSEIVAHNNREVARMASEE